VNRREKIIVVTLSIGLGVFLLYLGINSLLIRPLSDISQQRQQRDTELRELNRRNARRDSAQKQLAEMTSRTLGHNETEVAEQVRARLANLLVASGLTQERWRLSPLAAAPLSATGKDKRTGWSVNARGKLEQVLKFLGAVDAEPYLHRMENLKLTPARGEVTLDVNVLTLVLERAEKSQAATMPAGSPPTAPIDPHTVALIAVRDVFRPYIPKTPVVAAPTPAYTAGAGAPPPVYESPELRLRVVGLANWPEPEVVLSDLGNIKTVKIGQPLLNGELVAIDYRLMPYPDMKDILSEGRLIVRIGQEFWAVERGRTLGQKHKLRTSDLPPNIKLPPPSSAPADVAVVIPGPVRRPVEAAAATPPQTPVSQYRSAPIEQPPTLAPAQTQPASAPAPATAPAETHESHDTPAEAPGEAPTHAPDSGAEPAHEAGSITQSP
jgi:hypothetical protein